MVKQEVLAALDAARGRYISGQELAAQLGVSRTAVWKAVAALRRDGIPIKAVTNRGYTLAQSVDVLNAAAVAAQLDEATVKALQIEVVDRLPGTNAALRSRADAGAREGLVLIAQHKLIIQKISLYIKIIKADIAECIIIKEIRFGVRILIVKIKDIILVNIKLKKKQ